MAAEAPDPRTLTSWDDAFQYPIPVVQKLEQQLRSHAAENRERLRSLVGASYRDLLSTAETIIDMSEQMQHVESRLAHIGHNCNSRSLDRIARTIARSHANTISRGAEKYTFASQLAVLRNCPIVIARLLKSEGQYLLAAKVLVIARLLHKALSQGDAAKKPPIVDHLRDKLGSLRSKLLRRIDRRLARAAGDTDVLVETMCAYSLATSSTPTDVLRHFHHVRMEKILGSLQPGEGLKEHGVDALKLCLQTCQDTQAIFPRRLADALARLKTNPLVDNPDVRALYELSLDTHHRWIGEEARNYTPWPRHDELKRADAEKLLHQWSKQAVSAFLKGIKEVLHDTRDLKEVADLRRELVETWIVSGPRMAGVKSKSVLDELRDTMNEHLADIVSARSEALRAVIEVVPGVLKSWQDQQTPLSLLTATSSATELSNGAQVFKQRIVDTHHGRDGNVIRVVTAFDKWMDSVLEVQAIVKHMKETRWDDPLTDDLDVEDSDDDSAGEDTRQALLSGEDPRLLEEATQNALADALSTLKHDFEQISCDLSSDDEGDRTVTKAIFVLRVVREISDRVPRLRVPESATPPQSPFSAEALLPLHELVAGHVVRPVVAAYEKSLVAQWKSRSNSHILWEGQPPLPVQPAPSAFRVLQALAKSMAKCGSDLWVPEAVHVVKRMAADELEKVWDNCLRMPELSEEETAGGEEKAQEGSEEAKGDDSKIEQQMECLRQLAFDILYLHRFLSKDEESAVAGRLFEKAGLDEGMQVRLKKSTGDYARKTYLLFALLA
ncbi:hypothetical protein M011DRAFT_460809 [Sporormia fimetaria CBS 119925]|uniref:Conserved oligomeric Golgi complex subunit 1 n=1 Tax=Sporormia fimetaria CBS 119925 TaxID=1340428 RepID=A0A6A6V3Y3_9PLEO|nr:hypothetical protein M011DRAFT_460809 [Sporormia fimetaria CBS 119925]